MTILFKIVAITVAVGVTASAVDPFVGIWKLNPEKSKLMEGQRAESSTMVCEVAEGGYRFSSSNPSIPVALFLLDGKLYPVSATARFATVLGADEWSAQRLSANAIEATYLRAEKAAGTIRRAVSPDGRTFTSIHDGIRPSVEKVAYVNGFDKH